MGEPEDQFAEAEALLERLNLQEHQDEINQQQEEERFIEESESQLLEAENQENVTVDEAESITEEVVSDNLSFRLEKFIADITETLDGVYPDSYDVYTDQSYIKNNEHLAKVIQNGDDIINHTIIAIKFPEEIIENSKRQTNVIKDLFVFMYVYVYKHENSETEIIKLDSSIKGIRSSLREDEYNSHYVHSHLPRLKTRRNEDGETTSVIEINRFCLGGGTAMSISLMDLSLTFDIMKFELFLYQLSAYVRHESLSGGPYIRMDNIRIGSGISFNQESETDFNNVFYAYMVEIQERNLHIPIKSRVKNGENEVVYDCSNSEHLKILGQQTRYPYEKRENNTFFPIHEFVTLRTKEQLDSLSSEMFMFRGENVVFNVIPFPVSTTRNPTKHPSPRLLKHVETLINTNIKIFNTFNYAE